MNRIPVALAALPILLLAACGDDAAKSDGAADAASIEGEVLGGSISDDMLPLGELESQSPPLRKSSDGNGETGGDSGSGSADEDGAPAADSAPDAAAGSADDSAETEEEAD